MVVREDSIRLYRRFCSISESFIAGFIIKPKAPNGVNSLLMLNKGKNKMLHNYNKRYCQLYNEIDGCLEELAVVSYKLGLTPKKKLWDDLTSKSPIKLYNLMSCMEKYTID